MIVQQAREVARQWVRDNASSAPGFRGAFFHGSINWLPDGTELPPASDVDVMVVLDDPVALAARGKCRHRGVLLEVSAIAHDQVQTPEQILGRYDLAGSFRTPGIIADPSGELGRLQAVVAPAYAKREWVRRRCENAQSRVLRNLRGLDETAPFSEQVTAWLFGAGVVTHILLVAGLKNPTVRTRYLASRALLTEYGHLASYATLLEQLGCASMSQARAMHHLDALAAAFDAAASVIRTPFFFAADIGAAGRPVAIDGSRELIARGDHLEAVFWLAATWSRCQQVFAHDAPMLSERFGPGYRALLADLGITSLADLQARSEQVETSLPRVRAVTEAIIASNPEILD